MDYSYLIGKRESILQEIAPICEAFRIDDYDYEINTETGREELRIRNTRIGCCLNSNFAVVQELVGYLFMSYWRERSLGAFDRQTRNYIKQYWRKVGDR